ncbi:DUF1405 domain-containing protein [Halovivax gelatinilyticus]|uniref:DUF1405 domain-containing protein n=1 Tax=Halovivax gelatinilyticus TaxID=2961597 RepID=UPI0020CA95CE|nr:DUF1405 domain-containing protein [Halovivax gelatinilyticus]
MARSTEIPARDPLPRWVAPVPRRIEDFGLRLAWPIVAVNLAGTVFGFWYYRYQFAETPTVMWPFVPDSPIATLLFALAVAAWKLGRELPWLTALAFFGNVILGLWTPYTLLAFSEQYAEVGIHPAMFAFLFLSHLAMVVQALVLHRISDFPVWAVGVALLWYGVDLIVDYFVPVTGGDPHHTRLPVSGDEPMYLDATALGIAGAGATAFTLLALFLATSIRAKAVELDRRRR